MQDQAILNRAQLDCMRNLGKAANRDLVVELSASFIAEFPQRLASMQKALGKAQAQALEIEAHSLLAMCGHLGADRMMFLCEKIERCGRERKLEGADELLGQLAREHTTFLDALRAYQGESRDTSKS